MKKILLATAAIAFASIGAAQAATISPSSANIVVDGPRGTANDRDDITNVFDNDSSTFFELGYNAVVDFFFTPNFTGPSGVIIETTNAGSGFIEKVMIQVGFTENGVFTLLDTATPNPVTNATATTVFSFMGNGPFNTIRLTDVTCPDGFGDAGNVNPGCRGATGGFDVASLQVSAVPLPAGGFLLIGALGGLAALRRRKARAA